MEKLKNSTDDETDRKLVPEDEEEFKKNRTEQSKRKDKDDDDEEQCCKSSTSVLFLWLCSSGIHLKNIIILSHGDIEENLHLNVHSALIKREAWD